MKAYFVFLLGALLCSNVFGTPADISGLYLKTFGDRTQPALIFLHGGPGYNSHDFEITTAPLLAKQGYFVVVYDQRGQGRSTETLPENYCYRKYADDLKAVIDQLGLAEPTLLAHSHGGPIAISFDQLYPAIAKKIVLISAPIDFPGSLESLFENCAQRYAHQKDETKLREIAYVRTQLAYGYTEMSDEEKIKTVGAAFGHALRFCGSYSTLKPTDEEKRLRKQIKDNPLTQALSGLTTAMPGFLLNEDYIHRNYLNSVFRERERYCGIYGDEDGLFTPLSLSVIQNTLGLPGEPSRFVLLRGASHGIYLDQQAAFFSALRKTCGL